MLIQKTSFTRAQFFCLLFLVSAVNTIAQKTHSDNGDGTYTNPVIAADFPDPDVTGMHMANGRYGRESCHHL